MQFIFLRPYIAALFNNLSANANKAEQRREEKEKGGALFSSICSGTIYGLQSHLIQVEVDVSRGLPCLVMVGSLGSEVRESQERVKVALKNSGMDIPPSHISVNLSPADIHKSGTGFDLAIALGILTATEILDAKVLADVFVIGELGLSGEIKGVKGVLPLVWEAFRQGKKQCLVPRDNYAEASVIEGIRVAGAGSIQEACDYLQLSEEEQIKEELKQRRQEAEAQREWKKRDHRQEEKALDFAEVHGQENLKRGALIAAAGFHHMLIVGPPGAGKTMIAKRIPSILPELNFEESMEVTSIYSIAGRLPKGQNLIKKRPFLNPHHSVTIHALAGGGRIPQPGLVSLAHRGVLFLDELPEFQRQTIDLLRQPLEDKEIHIARSTGAFTYPADFMLVGAMNPCPCGYYPDRNRCKCTPFERHLYRSRLSGPMLDRMDLCLEAEKVEIGQLQKKKSGLSSAEMREMVNRARELQESRYKGTDIKFNSDLTMKDCEKYCCLGKQEQSYTERLSEKMQLSARGYHHLLKVARTIADLEGSEEIRLPHLAEAMSYRNMEPER